MVERPVHEATVHIVIDPGRYKTTWEIWLECEAWDYGLHGACEPLTIPAQRQGGAIKANEGPTTETVMLTGLQAGYKYWYSVLATSEAGTAVDTGLQFWTCRSLTNCSAEYIPVLSGPEQEQATKWGAEAPAREAERQAKKRREEEERASREAAEQKTVSLSSPARRCIVPRLETDSLAKAKGALRRADCTLGRVRRPKHAGRLVVTGQASRAGSKLASGASVGVTLGAPRRREHS